MPIFKRKIKTDNDKKKNPTTADESIKHTNVHRPSHVAIFPAGQDGRSDNDREGKHTMTSSKTHEQTSLLRCSLGNGSFAQSIAHEMAHRTPSPNNEDSTSIHRGRTQEVAFVNQNAPSKGSAVESQTAARMAERSRVFRSSDYFAQLGYQMQSYKSSSESESGNMSKGKGLLGHDMSNHSSDSGYESWGTPFEFQSRTPSAYSEKIKQQPSHEDSGSSLPGPSHIEDARVRFTIPTQSPKALDHSFPPREDVSPVDLHSDSAYLISNKLSTLNAKHTSAESMTEPTLSKSYNASSHTVDGTAKPGLPRTQALPLLPSDKAPPAEAILTSHIEVDESPKQLVEDPTKRQAAATESLSRALSAITALVTEQPKLPHLERIAAAAKNRSSIPAPPLAVLEGLKVNKKGKILDEEGDPIGELVEGDLLDCVRQKANANGEVLNEFGRVVGRVRTIAGHPEAYGTSTWSPSHTRQPSNDQRPVSVPTGRPRLSSVHSITPAVIEPTERPELSSVHSITPAVIEPTERPRLSSIHSITPPVIEPAERPRSPLILNIPSSVTETIERPRLSSIPNITSPITELTEPPRSSPILSAAPHVTEPIERPRLSPILTIAPPVTQPIERPRLPSVPSTTSLVPELNAPGHLEANRGTGFVSPDLELSPATVVSPVFQLPNQPEEKEPRQIDVVQEQQAAPSPLVASTPTPKDIGTNEQTRRLPCSASERSIPDLAKPYTRPSMSSVPEDFVPFDDSASENTSIFGYRGEIPLTDGPQQGPPMRPTPPTINTNPKLAMMYAQAGRAGANRTTTQFPVGVGNSSMGQRLGPSSPTNAPLRRSPLSSQGTSPTRSTEAHDWAMQRPGATRASSISSTSTNKPRMYFSHAGRVAMDPNASRPSIASAATKATEPPAAPEEKKTVAKKSRFGLGFGKKDKSAK